MQKEPEIVNYMTQNKINILGIADTKKKETGTKGATSALQHIEQQRVKWFRHLTRMSPKQPALRAYNTRHSRWRARGRPRRRWSDSVADTVGAHGMSLLQATRLAADRHLSLPATPKGTSGRKK